MRTFLYFCIEVIFTLPVIIATLIARFSRKKMDIGIGPDPIVNTPHHQKALELYGYTVESYVDEVSHITKAFDLIASEKYGFFPKYVNRYILYFRAIFRYRILYIYFNGGSLGFYNTYLWRIEPFLYKLAKVKVVVMPYGSDVQDLKRTTDLDYKASLVSDYPNNTRYYMSKNSIKIDLWSRYANHVITGCDWIKYMYYWDTLMISHFAIDMNDWDARTEINKVFDKSQKFNIVHAPNHRAIKGTKFIEKAIKELNEEGYNIELTLLEKCSNQEIKKAIGDADLVIDQLIIGWYAMFAIEAMCLNKPVVTYIDDKLKKLYMMEDLLDEGELPFFQADIFSIKEVIVSCIDNAQERVAKAMMGRLYVQKHHSLEVIGSKFDIINKSL